MGVALSFRRAAFHGENTLRTFLDKDDDEDEHSDLRQHSAGPTF
jgi:hypothetical protein